MCRLPVLAGLFIMSLLVLPTCARGAEVVRPGFALDPRIALGAYIALVETQFDNVLDGAQTLASTSDMQSADWTRIKGPLTVYAHGVPEAAAVWFATPDGSYDTVEKGAADQSLKDRAYFSHLMAGQAVEGVLVISHSTGRKSVVIAAPVTRDGKIVGAIGVSISVEKLAATIDARLHLPPDIVFYALDADGRTALHRDSRLMFEFPSEQGSKTLAAATRTMLSQPEGVVRYRFRGSERVALFRTSKQTGWIFVLGRSSAPASR